MAEIDVAEVLGKCFAKSGGRAALTATRLVSSNGNGAVIFDLQLPKAAMEWGSGEGEASRMVARDGLFKIGLRDYPYGDPGVAETMGFEAPSGVEFLRRSIELGGGADEARGYFAMLADMAGLGIIDGFDVQLGGKASSLAEVVSIFPPATLMDLGRFECGGKLWISDPCYDQDPGLGAFVDDAEGAWRAFAIKTTLGTNWGSRIHQIMAVRDDPSIEPLEILAKSRWKTIGSCSVDSGQAGFFDAAVHKPADSDGDDEVYYDACCDATLGHDGAGIVPGGAVSSSGFGDGGYDIKEMRRKGKLLGLRIDYIDLPREVKQFVGGLWASREAEIIASDVGGASSKIDKKKPRV